MNGRSYSQLKRKENHTRDSLIKWLLTMLNKTLDIDIENSNYSL